jgi:3-oxocholest-4-en-26-oyl-CoA dehydrogenase alpha subunit
MYIANAPAQLELRRGTARVLPVLRTPEERDGAEIGPARYAEVRRQLGSDGWLGLDWPAEYGGQGRSEFDQFVFFDEARKANAPVPMLALRGAVVGTFGGGNNEVLCEIIASAGLGMTQVTR